MVLEQKIVFVGNSTNTPEDSTAHEVVGIGAKPVNNLESLSQNNSFNPVRISKLTS